MNELRVVFDTNVLVSALLRSNSTPRMAVDAVQQAGTILISEPAITELAGVLRRDKIRRYIRDETTNDFLARLAKDAIPVEVSGALAACRDPKDDKFLELAVSGNATHIVTGDEDLLSLHPFRGISILTPRSFLASLQSKAQ